MTVSEIILENKHRPWDLPQGEWKFYQEWNDAVFLHWKVNPETLRSFVPNELEIDLIDGEAWVSAVAFKMQRIRPRYLPSFKPISDFDELNLRTYVKFNGKSGVYFLSIEAGNAISSKLAEVISELPYTYSEMRRSDNQFTSSKPKQGDKISISYRVQPREENKTPLDRWLTERYALFQDGKHGLNSFEIHHVEWPISNLELTDFDFNYPRFVELICGRPNLCHYSTGVEVLAWDKTLELELNTKVLE